MGKIDLEELGHYLQSKKERQILFSLHDKRTKNSQGKQWNKLKS